MPKMECVCGYVIALHGIPSRPEFELVPERVVEPIVDRLVAAKLQPEERFEMAAYGALSHTGTPGILHVVECPSCFRLAVFERASDRVVAYWYARESAAEGHAAEPLAHVVERLRGGEG
jgi:hypothetical protein